MPASDPRVDPNPFRAALLKMVFDKTHALYPTQFDKQHRDYALATKAKRMLTQLSQGQTPEDSLTEAEIEQAAYRAWG